MVNRFEATNRSSEVVPADRGDIWAALTDPELLTDLTPLLHRIDTHGDRWVWHMMGINALGVEIAPSFTETMQFAPRERIDFEHTPPPDGPPERAGADGVYRLADAEGGTLLDIEITIHVELPLPRVSRGAVQRVMEQSMARTGDRFGRNLLDHLGVSARTGHAVRAARRGLSAPRRPGPAPRPGRGSRSRARRRRAVR